MDNLRKAIEQEKVNQIKEMNKSLNTEEGLKDFVRWTLRKTDSYKGTFEQQKNKAYKGGLNKINKSYSQQIDKINEIEQTPDFKGELIITIEWRKSYMWGYNPKAFDNYGNESDSIGGCGYCKHSTATAQILNQNKAILKALYTLENKRIGLKNPPSRRDFIAYGTSGGILPSFAGGVGVSSHEDILKSLGLYMRSISSTDATNVHLITKKEVQ